MANRSAAPAITPCCPRCDYDQSGEVARWSDSCPMEGTCPECGLRFEWVDVLVLSRRELPWMYEHKRAWRPAMGRALRTGLHLFYPWRFWRDVKMSHRVAPGRAWTWLLLTMFVLWLPGAVLGVVHHYLVYNSPARSRAVPWEAYAQTASYEFLQIGPNPNGIVLASADLGRYVWHLVLPPMPYGVYFLTGFSVAMPLVLCTLGSTRHLRGIRVAHLMRASAYGLGWIALLLIFGIAENTASLASRMLWPGTGVGWEITAALYKLLWPMGWAVLAWVCVWWWYAIVRGWQLPRAWLVWLVLCVPSALAGCVAVYMCGDLGWLLLEIGVY